MTDERLYLDYMNGAEEAASVLVEKYGDSLTLFICGYIRDEHDAEDLMIEAFARMFVRLRPISEQNEGSFKAYLFKVGRNLALRHKGKHSLPFIGFDDIEFEPYEAEHAELSVIQDEKNNELYSALMKLKTEYREALYLVYINEMNYADAAKVLGKSEKQITNLIYRGKQSLRAILEKKGYTSEDQ